MGWDSFQEAGWQPKRSVTTRFSVKLPNRKRSLSMKESQKQEFLESEICLVFTNALS